jgi:hypothetical protein
MNNRESFYVVICLDQIALIISPNYELGYCQRSLTVGDFSHNQM